MALAMGCCADKGESDTQLRHEYILSPAFPVLRTNANAAWLTVGDLYYGFDAYALLVRGAKSGKTTTPAQRKYPISV